MKITSRGQTWVKNSLEKAIMVLGCARSKFVEDMKEIMRMKEDDANGDATDSEDAEDVTDSNETPDDSSDAEAGTEEVA